jgi:hypothetical protein
VKSQIGDWKLSENERTFFEGSRDLPNWRLADKARRMAADLSVYFSAQMPQVVDREASEIDAATARRWAIISATGITVRSASAAMMLIASGYLPESGGPARRMIEAGLNAQAVLADQSGQYAVRYLQGKPRGLTKLAAQFGSTEEVRILSIVTHADPRSLAFTDDGPPIGNGDVMEGTVSLLPAREADRAHDLLYAIAFECVGAGAKLAEAFGVAVEIPPWVSGELLRLRDVLAQRRADVTTDRG